MSSHHGIVTRSPNHWCAISCALTLANALRCRSARDAAIEQQQRVAERDRAGVLHRAGREVRHGEQVELVERIRDAEVVLEHGDDRAASRRARSASCSPLPLAATPRSGSGVLRTSLGGIGGASTTSNGPTANATRYVGSGWVVANVHASSMPVGRGLGSQLSRRVGDRRLVGRHRQRDVERRLEAAARRSTGNAWRALIGSNCVNAYAAPSLSTLYSPAAAIERRVIGQIEHRHACRQRFAERELGQTVVVDLLERGVERAAGELRLRVCDRQTLGVQPESRSAERPTRC